MRSFSFLVVLVVLVCLANDSQAACGGNGLFARLRANRAQRTQAAACSSMAMASASAACR